MHSRHLQFGRKQKNNSFDVASSSAGGLNPVAQPYALSLMLFWWAFCTAPNCHHVCKKEKTEKEYQNVKPDTAIAHKVGQKMLA